MSRDEDLLARMKRTAAGWHQSDLDRLLTSYGFVGEPGGQHTIYRHPDHTGQEYIIAIPRHRDVKNIYVKMSVRMVERILQEECQK